MEDKQAGNQTTQQTESDQTQQTESDQTQQTESDQTQQTEQTQTVPDVSATIAAQYQAQIDALMKQNAALNQQIVQMIQGGAQLGSQPAQSQQAHSAHSAQLPPQVAQMLQMGAQPDPLGTFNPPSLADGQDVSLEALASQIGKGDRR